MRYRFIVLSLICDLGSKSAARTEEAPLIHKQKRVRFMDHSGPAKKTRTRWEPICNSKKVDGPSEISTNRRACSFYVWNFVSASMYYLCRYLMKDAVFEGKGGRKFVRIEPGSLLELLYPASRHSPDKCIFCGGSYNDHMTLRWSKHIYSPYDLYMDRTYFEGVLQKVHDSGSRKGHRVEPKANDEPTMRYAFHTRYVHDLGLLFQGISRPKDKIRLLQQMMSEDEYLSDPADMKIQHDTIYAVPSIAVPSKGAVGDALLKLARGRVLDAIDALIHMEQVDNELLQTKVTM